jgi:hypothetical protein
MIIEDQKGKKIDVARAIKKYLCNGMVSCRHLLTGLSHTLEHVCHIPVFPRWPLRIWSIVSINQWEHDGQSHHTYVDELYLCGPNTAFYI